MIVDRSESRDDHHENDGDDDGARDVERDEDLPEQVALHTRRKVLCTMYIILVLLHSYEQRAMINN